MGGKRIKNALCGTTFPNFSNVSAHLPWSVVGFVRFVPFFLWHSLRGGVDVAGRALRWQPSIRPGLTEYRLRLSPEPARVFMMNAVSLLPGTLSARLQGACLVVHVLNEAAPHANGLRALEKRVGRIFGQNMSDGGGVK